MVLKKDVKSNRKWKYSSKLYSSIFHHSIGLSNCMLWHTCKIWHQHFSIFFSLRVSVVTHFQWEGQDQRSQRRADIKRISKMNSSFKSLHVGLLVTWWGFSYDFDDGRIKERSLIDGPVTCSHMKHGGSPQTPNVENRSNKDYQKPLVWYKIIKRFIIAVKPLICCFDFYFVRALEKISLLWWRIMTISSLIESSQVKSDLIYCL